MITAGSLFSLEQYRKDGCSGPIQGLTMEEAESGYRRFFEVLGQSRHEPGPAVGLNLSAWHQRHKWAYDLATHPSITGAMERILGPDLVLWAMHFWYKESGNPNFIPWHQDINYWPMEPEINATAWVTLGFSLRENGCLRIIPGTHGVRVPHETMEGQSAFAQGIGAEHIDESKAIDVEMTPGQVVFFDESTFHGSDPNSSHVPRVAFSVRYTTPEVRFLMDEWTGDASRIRTYLVRGQDRYRRNEEIRGTVPLT